MPLPTDDLIVWASSDVNLPNLAGPNKVKPIDDLILKGWDFKQKPAADEFNYVLNNLGMHVSYLEESKTYTFSGDVTGTATSTGSEDVTFNVSVTDNSHNHISANISDATSSNAAFMIVKRDANGGISIGDLTVNKISDTSTITFSASANDAGYIKHSETNDVSRMQFNISDNNDSIDKFEFGNTEGGSFVPRFTIDANGTTNVKSSVTATNFIGPLQGNALTASTLQTARTINGTSFNGSADITTNSWGTARTFALTSAVTGSVSVDGSGNISLATTYTGFTKSVGVTGYQQLPSGMVEMWTTVIIPTTTPATWTYPQTLSSVVSAVITPITGVTGEFYYITAGLSSAVIDNIPGNSAFTAYVVVKGYL